VVPFHPAHSLIEVEGVRPGRSLLTVSIVNLVPQFLILIAGVTIAVINYFETRRAATGTSRRNHIVALVAAVAVVLAGAWVAWTDAKDIALITNEASKARALTEDVRSEQTERGTTGYFMFWWGGHNLATLAFQNGGSYTLHAIQARIVDLTKLSLIEAHGAPGALPESAIKQAETLIEVGDLGPGQLKEVGTVHLPEQSERHGLNIWITTRFQTFTEEIRFRRVDGRWRGAYRVFQWVDDKPVVRKQQTSEFPKDVCGRPIWDWPGGPDGGRIALKDRWGACPLDPDQSRAKRD